MIVGWSQVRHEHREARAFASLSLPRERPVRAAGPCHPWRSPVSLAPGMPRAVTQDPPRGAVHRLAQLRNRLGRLLNKSTLGVLAVDLAAIAATLGVPLAKFFEDLPDPDQRIPWPSGRTVGGSAARD